MQRHRIGLAFMYTFNTAGAYVIARSAADALFLARAGVQWLPLMFVLSAVLLGITSLGFAKVSGGASLRKVVLVTLFLLATATISLCLAIQHFGESLWLLAGLYLLSELRGCLNSMQYGILLNEFFVDDPRFHQINGILGAAATLAGISFGAFVGFEAQAIGVTELLYVVVGVELLAMIPIALLGRTSHDNVDHASAKSELSLAAAAETDVVMPMRSGRGFRWAIQSARVRRIAVLVGLSAIVGTLVEFQWKSAVAAQFHTREGAMAEFIGLIHAVIGLASGAIQFVLTGRMLHRFSTPVLLSALPVMLFATTIGVLTTSLGSVLLWPITAVKGCDVIKRSLHNPVIWSLYAPIDQEPRRSAITFVTGIVKPLAEASAALLILVMASFAGPRILALIVLALTSLWMFAVWRNRCS